MESTYFYCKCSICFENDSEMEFINCGDQFCLACLERYVEYWIREASWGLIPGSLTCPVCGIKLMDNDWMPYISGRLMQIWKQYQVKRKATLKEQVNIGRSCPDCNNFQTLIGKDSVVLEDLLLVGHEMISQLDELEKEKLEDWQRLFEVEQAMILIQDASEMEIIDLVVSCKKQFDNFLSLIEVLKKQKILESHNKDLIRLIMEFGRKFLNILNKEIKSSNYFDNDEDDEEHYSDDEEYFCDDDDSDNEDVCITLIEMQLNFQCTFPFSVCDACECEICLPCCATYWFHADHQIRMQEQKKCPRCFIAIDKEPEGCNEMRCNYCGMNFCWECGRKWSKDCGIYKCKQKSETSAHSSDEAPRSEIDDENAVKMDNSMRDPEIGVPNVRMIRQMNGSA